MEKINLNIAEPCLADWNTMTATEKGKFCGACQKEVVDFTAMEDSEIIAYFAQINHRVCGRFYEEQLDQQEDKKYRLIEKFTLPNAWRSVAAGLLLLGTLYYNPIHAQSKVTGIVSTVKVDSGKSHHNPFEIPQKNVAITGIVYMENKQQPLSNVAVKFGNYQVETDSQGKFVLEFPIDLIGTSQYLELHKIGFVFNRILIDASNYKSKFVIVLTQKRVLVGKISPSKNR